MVFGPFLLSHGSRNLRFVPMCLQLNKLTILSLCDVVVFREKGMQSRGLNPWEPSLEEKKGKMLPFLKGLLPAWSPC